MDTQSNGGGSVNDLQLNNKASSITSNGKKNPRSSIAGINAKKKLMSATRKMSIMKNMSGDDKVSKYEVKVKFKKMQLFLDQSSTFKV